MKTLLLLLLGFFPALAVAADQQFTFALPELEGRISLGVYNESKQLVRTLRVQAKDSDFTIGINGLVTTWDGKNDAGQDQPAGKYFIRGYVVGDAVKSEGIDYHFNDWIESENSPPLQNPQLMWASGQDIFLLGLNGLICRYGEAGGLQKDFTLPEPAPFYGSGEGFGLFESPGSLFSLNFAAPEKSLSFPLGQVSLSSATVWRGKSYLAPSYGSSVYHLTAFNADATSGEIDSPENLRLLDANSAALVASDQQHVWIFRGKKFEQVPFAEDITVFSLSAGLGDTFWIVGQVTTANVKGPPFVRQYSFLGELLRQLACDTTATTIFADKTQERIFLSQSPDPATKTIKGLRSLPGESVSSKGVTKVVDWEVFMEKTSTDCRGFGLVNGSLVADAGKTPQQNTRRVELAESLQPTRQSLDLQVQAGGGEIWLQTSDGLHLMPIGLLEGGDRCVVAPGDQAGALKVYAGNGAVVAEYLVTGADQIAEIDAGEIDLP